MAEKMGFICSNFRLYNMPSGLDDNEDDTDYEEVLSGFINSHYFLSSARSEADSTSLCSKESEVCDTVLYASILFVGKWL